MSRAAPLVPIHLRDARELPTSPDPTRIRLVGRHADALCRRSPSGTAAGIEPGTVDVGAPTATVDIDGADWGATRGADT